MTERLARLLVKVRNKGVRGAIGALALRARRFTGALLRHVWGLFAWPSFSTAVLVLRVLRVRFFQGGLPGYAPYRRIGHLALEPDCFIKEGQLGLRDRVCAVILVPADKVANLCLLNYWRRYMWVITSPFWCRLLKPFEHHPSLSWSANHYLVARNETARFGTIQAAWGQRPPLLRLSRFHRGSGEARLRDLGVPSGAWFVCVHCREGGYDRNAPRHALRNVDIESYVPAMKAIVERGGWCVRMGDASMKPLRFIPGVIDYAHSPLRCDWMDIFLCASCKFFLGSASGLSAVATIFGVRSAVANQILPYLSHPVGINDLLIPKLLWSPRLRRYLTFPEIAQSPLSNAREAHCFAPTDIVVHDNTPEDLQDLVLDMLDQIEGQRHETPEDRHLQDAYQALFRPDHYSFGAVSRIGTRFLRKYRHLLEVRCEDGPIPLGTLAGCGTQTCPCLTPGWKPPLCA